MADTLVQSVKGSGSLSSDCSDALNRILCETQNDASEIIRALRELAREYGMSRLARETGLSRESLYKSLSGSRSPEFATILKILNALNLDFAVREKSRGSQTS